MISKKKNIRRLSIVCIIFAIMVLLVGYQTVHAGEVIRVGFFEFAGYHDRDDAGNKSGYGYEFIQKMLRYNNYTAEYVGYEKSWSEMQKMLEEGKIDILTSAQKTPERQQKFDFSEPIGTSSGILTIKAGNDKYSAGEYNTYNGMRIGVINGNSRNDGFMKFASDKGFKYTFIYYNDVNSMVDDLQKGERIDAAVTSNLRLIQNEWILDNFDITPFYAMVKKGNTELLTKVNYAIEQMNSNSIGWQDELYSKYYAGDTGDTIALSSIERKYLKELQDEGRKIKVAVNPDRTPYSYLNNGKPEGIIPEIFEETALRLELPYEYVVCETREEYQRIKENGEVDVVIDARNDLSAAEDAGFKLTDSYMDLSYAIVRRSEFSGDAKSIAMLTLSYTSDQNINQFMENKKVLYFDSMDECVDAVLNKKADACYLYNYCAQKYAIENVDGNIQATTLPDLNDKLVYGVRSSEDYRLLAILNKGANSVKNNFCDTAIKKYTDFSLGDLSFLQLMVRNPVIPIAFIVILSFTGSLLIYSRQKNMNEKKEQEKNKELERFIGYVCKANTSVMEVNFQSKKAREYLKIGEHIESREKDYDSFEMKKNRNMIQKTDYFNISKTINENNIDEIIRRGEDCYFEYRIKEDGEYHWYAVTMTAIPVDEEHPKNMIIFKRDINETKRKEEETNQSLKDALEAANQASTSKGNFLSNMSHEIRTPLNAIIGYLTIAKDKDITREKQLTCIDNCDIASRHLLQIINDILDMSSIESGKLKIAHEEFDLKKEINDITTIFFQNAKMKGVYFETHIENLTEEWILGDQLRLNQILMNLLSNAVKFTPENGTVKLLINQINQDEHKVYFQFVVQDTGIGMSPEYMSRIFHPFEQESAGTARKFGGSGLGLSITNNLIHMMGGNIDVQSKQNEGTSFTVTMYFDKSNLKHDDAIKSDYSHVRVLVVDDQESECSYVKTMLKRCGVKADTATSGETALKRIQSRMGGDYEYSLCIIDWNMPDMNGCEVTRNIREMLGKDVPVIIATAYDISELEDEAKSAGVNKIVSKPLFQSTLFDLLVSTFGQYKPDENGREKEVINMTGVHILLAEDNPMNMDIAVTMLEKTGIKVDQAVNGKEACDIFMKEPEGTYDLILMDVQMPVMDGYEATRTIRKSNHPEAKTIPIIAMTANAFAEDITDALSNGMNAHIAKPINYDKLFSLLKEYRKGMK